MPAHGAVKRANMRRPRGRDSDQPAQIPLEGRSRERPPRPARCNRLKIAQDILVSEANTYFGSLSQLSNKLSIIDVQLSAYLVLHFGLQICV